MAVFQISKVYRRDTNKFHGGLLFYFNENISCRELTAEQIASSFEIMFLKITLRTQKWLIIGLYRPLNQKKDVFKKILVKL